MTATCTYWEKRLHFFEHVLQVTFRVSECKHKVMARLLVLQEQAFGQQRVWGWS